MGDQTGVVTGTSGYYRVCVKGALDTNGDPVEVHYTSGELAGYRQLRDGNAADDVGIPHIINRLNELCQRHRAEIQRSTRNRVYDGLWFCGLENGNTIF